MQCLKPLKIKIGLHAEDRLKSDYDAIVPCGKCIACRVNKGSEWSLRLQVENSYHEQSTFLTLTYNEEHLKEQLNKRDIQLFLKRLRKALSPQKIRYYLAGEYGPATNRPHYHLIIFGYYPKDNKVYKRTKFGMLYTSKTITDLWGMGHTSHCLANEKTINYVTSYITDYNYFTPEGELKEEKPFSMMSKHPFLGPRLAEVQESILNFGIYYHDSKKIKPHAALKYKVQNLHQNKKIIIKTKNKIKNQLTQELNLTKLQNANYNNNEVLRIARVKADALELKHKTMKSKLD